MPNHLVSTHRTPSAFCGHPFPKIITDAGDDAMRRFVEFFTANIRNKNTRQAYARAVGQFCDWCEQRKFSLELLEPVVIAAYIEELGGRLAKPSVKQHLAAIRVLFDYLVVGQIVPMNPAASVRGPKHVVKRGKTPVLSADDTRRLLDSIDISTIVGLRDRAIIAVMVFSFARVSAPAPETLKPAWSSAASPWMMNPSLAASPVRSMTTDGMVWSVHT